ncbi:hypothetical protein FEM48_Zijuj03G0053900 [Ziziphus jujuba var. spinosa]|uniref:Alpha-1,6-glucosidases pullulanase-type C-terminal domain-containing protein n=1 Tax=Ziziphus jujuba var. spinosa TaxID=714518 RepID=A0A978VNF3_ZIZJJ|nr:hypothetical protein FEM48_Zijuj03G0053900 [Ziziphus jujuba var. spinosa]
MALTCAETIIIRNGSAPFDENSVLNKIVPGYYLRTSTDGFIENGTFDYRYGEGWDFGEVAKNGRGVKSSQFSLPGTGIGRIKSSKYSSSNGMFNPLSRGGGGEEERIKEQGILFFYSGDEMLRSKSLDCDLYNSGDWFNRLDLTYHSNNWGFGLPPGEWNEKNWPLIQPKFADPSFKHQKSHILAAVENFSNLLPIRVQGLGMRSKSSNSYSSIQVEELCHVKSELDVLITGRKGKRVHFLNAGSLLVPGVIAMSIEDGHDGVPGLSQLDPILLLGWSVTWNSIVLMSPDHVVKSSTGETSMGCFNVPARTTSMFVELFGKFEWVAAYHDWL